MKRIRRCGGFLPSLLFNLLWNLEGLLPAAVLLGLHFWLGWSPWWAVLAAALWLLGIILRMLLIGWARHCGDTPDPPKRNKNPYSVGNRHSPE